MGGDRIKSASVVGDEIGTHASGVPLSTSSFLEQHAGGGRTDR